MMFGVDSVELARSAALTEASAMELGELAADHLAEKGHPAFAVVIVADGVTAGLASKLPHHLTRKALQAALMGLEVAMEMASAANTNQ